VRQKNVPVRYQSDHDSYSDIDLTKFPMVCRNLNR
jgi:hypothetical protein